MASGGSNFSGVRVRVVVGVWVRVTVGVCDSVQVEVAV